MQELTLVKLLTLTYGGYFELGNCSYCIVIQGTAAVLIDNTCDLAYDLNMLPVVIQDKVTRLANAYIQHLTKLDLLDEQHVLELCKGKSCIPLNNSQLMFFYEEGYWAMALKSTHRIIAVALVIDNAVYADNPEPICCVLNDLSCSC